MKIILHKRNKTFLLRAENDEDRKFLSDFIKKAYSMDPTTNNLTFKVVGTKVVKSKVKWINFLCEKN